MVDVVIVELVVVGCKLNDSSTEDVIEYNSFKYDLLKFIGTEWILNPNLNFGVKDFIQNVIW